MAEKYGFFNDVDGDRSYYDDQMTLPFGAIVGNAGVVRNIGEELKPSIGTGLQIKIGAGLAFLGVMPGWWYQTTYEKTLNISAAQAGMKRVDTIVLKLDRNTAERKISLTAVEGTEDADTPSAPSLTQDETVYELALAEVSITESTITAITDIRQFSGIGNAEKVSIKNITVDNGVELGDFIYPVVESGQEIWKLDDSEDKTNGRFICGEVLSNIACAVFSGITAMPQTLIATLTQSDINARYSLYVQSNGGLGLGVTNTHAGFILSNKEMYVDLKPIKAKPKAYLANMEQFFAVPGASGKMRLKVEMPTSAEGVLIKRSTTAYDDTGIAWGDEVANVTDDSGYKGTNQWLTDDNSGANLTNDTTYYYKAFPYAGGIYNDTNGENETLCEAGTYVAGWTFDAVSGNIITDDSGYSRAATATGLTFETGKVGNQLRGSGAGSATFTEISMIGKTVCGYYKGSGLDSGVIGNTASSAIGILEKTDGNLYVNSRVSSVSLGSAGPGIFFEAYFTSTQVSIYANGVFISTTNLDTYQLTIAFNVLARAQIYGGSVRYLNGVVDQIRIFNGQLSAASRANLINGGVGC